MPVIPSSPTIQGDYYLVLKLENVVLVATEACDALAGQVRPGCGLFCSRPGAFVGLEESYMRIAREPRRQAELP